MRNVLITLVFLAMFAVALPAEAQTVCNGGTCTYVPLEPIPGAQQSGTADFAAFLSGIFKILITFGGLFAVVMIVVAGIGYMISESAVEIDKAKGRAKAALWGLLLLTGSWLILNTINPDLLKFNLNSLGKFGNPTPTNTTTGTPLQITITPNQVKIFDGSDAYSTLIEQQNKCNGTLHAVDRGVEDGRQYSVYKCQ